MRRGAEKEISRRREGAESGISRRREGATGISFANPFAPRRLCERFLFAPLVTALTMLAAISAPSTTEAQAVVRRVPPPGEPNVVDYRIFFRSRAELFWNLDLDRGNTPSGDPLFPVPQADPLSQLLTHGDMRLRTDLAFNVGPSSPFATRLFFHLLRTYDRLSPTFLERFLVRDRPAFRAALERILAWPFERVVVAHGDVKEHGGRAELEAGYGWVLDSRKSA